MATGFVGSTSTYCSIDSCLRKHCNLLFWVWDKYEGHHLDCRYFESCFTFFSPSLPQSRSFLTILQIGLWGTTRIYRRILGIGYSQDHGAPDLEYDIVAQLPRHGWESDRSSNIDVDIVWSSLLLLSGSLLVLFLALEDFPDLLDASVRLVWTPVRPLWGPVRPLDEPVWPISLLSSCLVPHPNLIIVQPYYLKYVQHQGQFYQ